MRTISRKSGSRTSRSTGKPSGTGPETPNAVANAALQKVTRSSLSTASTPSTMPVRMASRRAPSSRTLSTSSLTCAATRPSDSASAPNSSAEPGSGIWAGPATRPSTKTRSRPMRRRSLRENRNAPAIPASAVARVARAMRQRNSGAAVPKFSSASSIAASSSTPHRSF
ncbi:MAG: hypothetical protein ABSG56_07155 [Bryobacteraceae bacterium]